jgi:hypothetical protein
LSDMNPKEVFMVNDSERDIAAWRCDHTYVKILGAKYFPARESIEVKTLVLDTRKRYVAKLSLAKGVSLYIERSLKHSLLIHPIIAVRPIFVGWVGNAQHALPLCLSANLPGHR